MPLDPARIDLWCVCIDDIDAPRLLPCYRRLLSGPETERLARLRFERDRVRGLVARALVRTVLSRYGPLAPQEWEFRADGNGRPRLCNPPPGTRMEFNLSHSGAMIVLGIGAGMIGVDVECITRQSDTEALERYFAPSEREALRALPARERRRRFFELWTLKEAYLKARGVGLRLPLDRIAFEFAGEHGLRFSLESPLADTSPRWRLWQFAPRTDYVVAVCAERSGELVNEPLTVRETVPLESESVMRVPVSRSTVHCG